MSRQGLTLEVQCTFTNQGSNRATVTLRGVSIVDKQSLAELPGMVEQFTPPEGEGNTVLPGLTGSNTYFIRLTAAGLQSVSYTHLLSGGHFRRQPSDLLH